MNYRPLGNTGLDVSVIGLGTVSLGTDYGIQVPGEAGRPSEAEAVALIRHAAEVGINLFDTAPGYGESERLLGTAMAGRECIFATKVAIPRDDEGVPLAGRSLKRAVEHSLADSLGALRRDVLDIVQIHNASTEIVEQGEMAEVLLGAKRQGEVRFLGASVYTEEEAMAVISAGQFDVLQVAYNLLDQRMAGNVLPLAEQAGIGVIGRSAFLKGALTIKVQWLPEELQELRQAADRARDAFGESWESFASTALRFCLSAPGIAAVLVGPRALSELEHAITAAEAGPLPPELLARSRGLALGEERLLNPTYWSVR